MFLNPDDFLNMLYYISYTLISEQLVSVCELGTHLYKNTNKVIALQQEGFSHSRMIYGLLAGRPCASRLGEMQFI